ncbi:Fe-S cluster assembly protein SufD [Mycetocola tolaasinivorans]|uniref:Fe-S cluster assembly protein SufD n=1 Tax=Mycetocola tolaasinivorans TaxID=76635 RepID=A0A3L7A2P7_9MICO|nr:Fe-S cluster assembly protein SufD [Mycetocola tolaasinivorans]RLP74290.1 Fe-S cluster assembly protein SufD [Mycetocola tolaasinivorans]
MTTTSPATSSTETEQHGFKAHSDGGDAFVPVQTRSERFGSTNVADFPAVTGREPAWKYTPVAQLSDLIDGELNGSEYPFEAPAVDGVTVAWVGRDDKRIGTAGTPENKAAANAWTAFEKALVISVTGEEEKTFRLHRTDLGDGARAAHTVIEAAPHSRALVILENAGQAALTENIEIIVGDGAQLTVVSVQEWAEDARHLAEHFAEIGRDAKLKHVAVTLGGKIVRVNPSTHLGSQGADIEALGVYFADAHQHLEQHVYVDHDAENTRSRVSYKGALQGEGAHTVWIGDVLIRQTGTATDSYEENRNLVLSEGTRADSVPNLEIETGDIAGAGHASATGRFDDEQLFYLMARGIAEADARRLVVHGFLVEIIQRIGDAELGERIEAAIERELAAGDLPS